MVFKADTTCPCCNTSTASLRKKLGEELEILIDKGVGLTLAELLRKLHDAAKNLKHFHSMIESIPRENRESTRVHLNDMLAIIKRALTDVSHARDEVAASPPRKRRRPARGFMPSKPASGFMPSKTASGFMPSKTASGFMPSNTLWHTTFAPEVEETSDEDEAEEVPETSDEAEAVPETSDEDEEVPDSDDDMVHLDEPNHVNVRVRGV